MRPYVPFFNLLRMPLGRHRAWNLETARILDATAPAPYLDGLRSSLSAHSARLDTAEQLRHTYAHATPSGTAAAVSAARTAEDLDPTRLLTLDSAVDLALARLLRKWHADADAFGPSDPIGRAAAQLASALFPDGLAAHTRLSHTEQYAKNAQLLAALRSGAWDDALSLTSSAVLVDRAEAAIHAFQAAYEADLLRRTAAPTVTFDDVREAELRCHEAFLSYFVDALSLLQAQPDLLSQLLAPLLRHQDDQRAARRLGPRSESPYSPADDPQPSPADDAQ